MLNGLRCPSVTIECGGHDVAEPDARDAVGEAITNLMKHLRMRAGAVVPQTIVPAHLNLDNLHRSMSYPFMPCTGIADFQKRAGDSFAKGDLLVVVRSMSGVKLAEVRAEHPGFVVGWRAGIAHQKGVCLGSCGLPDGLPMVVDYAEATSKL